MPRTRRTRSIRADPAAVWELVGDPRNLPRWWPHVERVEGVESGAFTQVLRSSRGRAVRADFRVAALEPPHLARWEQQLEGSPFERVLRRSALTISLEPAQDGTTLVTLELDRSLAGVSRLGAPVMRRVAATQLEAALDLLAQGVAGQGAGEDDRPG